MQFKTICHSQALKLAVLSVVLNAIGLSAVAKKVPDKLIVLTFDDGAKSHYNHVAPLLKKYHFNATFFFCEFPPDFADTSKYMTWQQVQSLSQQGFEIGNHTWHHKHVNKLDSVQLATEIAYVQRKCDSLGIPTPTTFAYPGYDTHVKAVSVFKAQSFTTARTGWDRPYLPTKDHPFYIPSYTIKDADTSLFYKATQQANNGNIIVLTFHGVPDYAHDWVSLNPTVFAHYLQYLSAHRYKVIAMRDLSTYVNWSKAMQLPIPNTSDKHP